MTSTDWNTAIDAAVKVAQSVIDAQTPDVPASPNMAGGRVEAATWIKAHIEALRTPDPASDEREAVARAIQGSMTHKIYWHVQTPYDAADAALSILAPYRAAEIAVAQTMGVADMQRVIDEQAATIARVTGTAKSLLALCEQAGLADDLLAAVFPDSKNRSGQTRDETAKQARRTMNEARAALTGAA